MISGGLSCDSFELSLPGLTRQSILFERLFPKVMDTRVKPAYDKRAIFVMAGLVPAIHVYKTRRKDCHARDV